MYAIISGARPRERSDRSRFLLIGKKASSYRGAYRVPFYLKLVCPSDCLSACVKFVVFTDCESCTRPISTNPASMEASGYGLTRGTCFVVRHLGVVAVAGLLWISLCVLGGAIFFVVLFLFSILFLSSNAHGLLQV